MNTQELATAVPRAIRFHAIGTEILVVSAAAVSLGDVLHLAVARHERRFSRFLPNSELERLSASSGTAMAVSPELFEVLEHAMRFWRETGGIFDPLIRAQLELAGYDRTFEAVPQSLAATAGAPKPGCAGYGDVVLVRRTRSVTLPAGSRLDLGGIAKGWIVDRLAELLEPHGPFLVDAGGDIVARGDGPDGGPGWLVGVEDPFQQERDVCWLRVADRAVATSTTMRRRWKRRGETLHHLIDPRTGRPSTSKVVQATVLAPAAMEADVYAKTALMLGKKAGLAWLARHQLAGLLITPDEALRTPHWSNDERKAQG